MTMFVFIGTASVAATGEFLVDDTDLTVKANVARIMPIATTFGIAIVVLAFGAGPISGGHINPAVTLALLIHRRVSPFRACCYCGAQFIGAVFGSLLLWASISQSSYAFHNPATATTLKNFTIGVDVVPAVGNPPFFLGANALNPVLSPGNGLLLEIMGTSLLVGTVLLTAADKRSMGKSINLAPIPIGFSVWIAHLCLIPWTGCGINPARTFGPHFVNSIAGKDMWKGNWWIYYLGPAFGSILTSLVVFSMWGGAHPPPADDEGELREFDKDEMMKLFKASTKDAMEVVKAQTQETLEQVKKQTNDAMVKIKDTSKAAIHATADVSKTIMHATEDAVQSTAAVVGLKGKSKPKKVAQKDEESQNEEVFGI